MPSSCQGRRWRCRWTGWTQYGWRYCACCSSVLLPTQAEHLHLKVHMSYIQSVNELSVLDCVSKNSAVHTIPPESVWWWCPMLPTDFLCHLDVVFGSSCLHITQLHPFIPLRMLKMYKVLIAPICKGLKLRLRLAYNFSRWRYFIYSCMISDNNQTVCCSRWRWCCWWYEWGWCGW